MKKYFFPFITILFLINSSRLLSHNKFNGGCSNHCNNEINNLERNKILNYKGNRSIDNESQSCLKKSLCRG